MIAPHHVHPLKSTDKVYDLQGTIRDVVKTKKIESERFLLYFVYELSKYLLDIGYAFSQLLSRQHQSQ